MGKTGTNTTKRNKTMNEIISEDGTLDLGGASDATPVAMKRKAPRAASKETVEDIPGEATAMTIDELKETPNIKRILEYNAAVGKIDKGYSDKALRLMDGTILVRLFKRIPVRNGVEIALTVPKMGKQQLKAESVRDPYHFDNIGVVVNLDPTYEVRNITQPGSWDLKEGDIVQIKEMEAVTIMEYKSGELIRPPHLKSQYFKYDETGAYIDLGYVAISSREIKAKLIDFNIQDYQEKFFNIA